MLDRTVQLAVITCLLLAGCSSPDPPPEDAGPPDTGPPDAGLCAEPVSAYGVDVHEQKPVLADGSILPITLGFQGFQYVRVGLRTERALPATADVWVQVVIDGELDRATAFAGVETRAAEEGGVETADVNMMFNDVPLAQLVGQHASLRIWTTSPGCRLDASVEVVLIQGVYQAADGGVDGGDGG